MIQGTLTESNSGPYLGHNAIVWLTQERLGQDIARLQLFRSPDLLGGAPRARLEANEQASSFELTKVVYSSSRPSS